MNRDITLEKTGTYNIGFELLLNRGIFGMELDYFYKLTNDILIPSGGIYPPSLGGNHPSTINGGKVSNKGFELVLTHQNNISDFHHSVRGNVSWSRNKVLRMNESPNVLTIKNGPEGRWAKDGVRTRRTISSDEEVINSATLAHL